MFTNNVLSATPVDDPVFSAHIPLYDQEQNLTRYRQDFAAKAMGCAVQVSIALDVMRHNFNAAQVPSMHSPRRKK